MIVTKEQLKAEIDKVRDEDLGFVYHFVRTLEGISLSLHEPAQVTTASTGEWRRFVAETYGSCADAPLERGDQGDIEVRDSFR